MCDSFEDRLTSTLSLPKKKLLCIQPHNVLICMYACTYLYVYNVMYKECNLIAALPLDGLRSIETGFTIACSDYGEPLDFFSLCHSKPDA